MKDLEYKIKCKIINENNLSDNDMDGAVTRIKAFIMNHENEIMVASSNGGIQLIGGHVEDGENHIDTLKREIMEEAGIKINDEEISEVFYEVRHYCKNYFNSGKNKIANIFYYIIKTDKIPDLNHVNLTKQEQCYNFKIKYVPYDDFKRYVSTFLNSEKEVNRWIAKEMLEAFAELENK